MKHGCIKFKEAIESKFIRPNYQTTQKEYKKDPKYIIRKSYFIIENRGYRIGTYDWSERDDVLTCYWKYVYIKYCPFCGKKIGGT